MTACPGSIQEMYPPVPVGLLVSDEWQRRFREMFLASGELDADPFLVEQRTERPHRKCVSVCLFKQAVDNQYPRQHAIDEERWRRKYWEGLQGVAEAMPRFPDWKLRIYVERSMWDTAHAEFSAHPQIEIFGMATDTVGAHPGMLWRLLAFNDLSLDVVVSTDIDEPLEGKADYFAAFEMDDHAVLGRVGGFASHRQYLIAPGESEAKNYATIIGSCVMARPARFRFDIAAAMRGFMAWRRSMANSNRPWAYADDDTLNAYNQPIGGHVYGWGSHWFTYCFDERFLKHVLYYHFAEKGSLHTWATSLPPERMDPEGRLDLRHARERGNTTANPHHVVRLAPLALTPAAREIAFRLDEHRWIFESLLALMHQHAQTGYCGNLCFHRIDEPWALELVPKQLNLFDAARHATRVLEIGFNAGHSSAIMLLANPQLTIRAFDTCGLAYTRPCLHFLNAVFGGRISLIEGRSQDTVASDPKTGYDLLHVDGDHTRAAVAADLANALPKCVAGAIVVMDDLEDGNEVAQATYQRVDLDPTNAYARCAVYPGSSHAFFHYRKPGPG